MGHGGKWRKTWQNEEIAGRKCRKAKRYAGHRVKQMEKSKEPKVSGEQWPLLGFRPRQETRNEEQQSLASGAKAVTQSQADGKKSKELRVNGGLWPLGFGPRQTRQFARG